MKSWQRIIKYLAVSFAFLLTFSIIGLVMSGVLVMGNIFSNKTIKEQGNIIELNDMIEQSEFEKISTLNIKVTSSNVVIKPGDKFKIETSNEYIECREEDGTVSLNEKKHSWFNDTSVSNLIVYIPKNVVLKEVNINSSAGTVSIDELLTEKLDFDLGAGKVSISNLSVLDRAKINGGAGEVNISNSNLNNLELDIGIGKFTVEAKLSGNSEIDHGLGEVILNLLGEKENYQIHADKNIGSLTIDSNKIKDDYTYGNGSDRIDIDGGVGSIIINFMEE